MADEALDYSYRYPFPSAAELAGGAGRLRLATANVGAAGAPAPHFFRGRLRQPAAAAQLLLGVAQVAQSRFYTPPGMLQRILREADPVVTAGGDRLRFEAFSLCCGVYARADLLPAALDGEIMGRGTTNVDFNAPFRAALSRIERDDRVELAVGSEAVALTHDGAALEERKVKLPQRWLKGFVEAQSYGPRLTLHHEIPGPAARRFLAGLSAAVKAKDRCWLAVEGPQPRLSQRAAPGMLAVGGIGRLTLLAPLARQARSLKIYGDAESGVTAWVLALEGARFELLLSPEAGRGFSGEGQVLSALAEGAQGGETALAAVRAALAWQAQLTPESLADRVAAAPAAIAAALANLGSQGLVGYDLGAGCHFHREMPFDLAAVVKLHPRLARAEALLAEDAVEIVSPPGAETLEAYVKSGDVEQRVVLTAAGDRCSCPWFNRKGGAAGPCKHVLAVRMARDAAAKPSKCR